LRFGPLQHSPAALRCPRLPTSNDPASAFRTSSARAVADQRFARRPCGFTLRGSKAAMLARRIFAPGFARDLHRLRRTRRDE
jgi:hypothetical protein